jgi:AmmeMemoRadiSam system protein B
VLAWDVMGALDHAGREQSACCPGAVAACMSALGQGSPKLVDHYLSYDVRPASSFVGYAGILL